MFTTLTKIPEKNSSSDHSDWTVLQGVREKTLKNILKHPKPIGLVPGVSRANVTVAPGAFKHMDPPVRLFSTPRRLIFFKVGPEPIVINRVKWDLYKGHFTPSETHMFGQ